MVVARNPDDSLGRGQKNGDFPSKVFGTEGTGS